MHVSIIIPIYNEEKNIKKNIEKIYSFFDNYLDFEIIIVNDGSTDKSLEVLQQINFTNIKIISNQKNIGKGAASRKGVEKSNGEMILITDADLSAPIDEFDKLYDVYRKGYDIVIGSRSAHDADLLIKQTKMRIISGKIYNILACFILNLNFKDTQCGFKLFKSSKIKEIMTYSIINRFSIDTEILFLAKKLKFSIFEKGIIWRDSPNTSVRLVNDSINMFCDLLIIRTKKYFKNRS